MPFFEGEIIILQDFTLKNVGSQETLAVIAAAAARRKPGLANRDQTMKTIGREASQGKMEKHFDIAVTDDGVSDARGNSPLSFSAGYRMPGIKYTRDHSSGWLHQLMLTYVDDPSKIDDTIKWQSKGCYGHVVERTDRKLILIARKVYGDADRWPELANATTYQGTILTGWAPA